MIFLAVDYVTEILKHYIIDKNLVDIILQYLEFEKNMTLKIVYPTSKRAKPESRRLGKLGYKTQNRISQVMKNENVEKINDGDADDIVGGKYRFNLNKNVATLFFKNLRKKFYLHLYAGDKLFKVATFERELNYNLNFGEDEIFDDDYEISCQVKYSSSSIHIKSFTFDIDSKTFSNVNFF
jgi:hypothetical protein